MSTRIGEEAGPRRDALLTGISGVESVEPARSLARLAGQFEFRLGSGLHERVAYRELFPLGLTHIDLRRIPEFARAKVAVAGEVMHLLDDLEIDREADGLLAGMAALPIETQSA